MHAENQTMMMIIISIVIDDYDDDYDARNADYEDDDNNLMEFLRSHHLETSIEREKMQRVSYGPLVVLLLLNCY